MIEKCREIFTQLSCKPDFLQGKCSVVKCWAVGEFDLWLLEKLKK